VPTTLPLATAPTVDLRVLLFAMALTGVTGVLFGLAPVLRIGGEADLGGLRDGAPAAGGQRERFRSALVIAEIVASVVLLVSAGLLMRALWTIQARDPGFKTDGVLTMGMTLHPTAYGKVATREAFYTRVTDEVRALPGEPATAVAEGDLAWFARSHDGAAHDRPADARLGRRLCERWRPRRQRQQ